MCGFGDVFRLDLGVFWVGYGHIQISSILLAKKEPKDRSETAFLTSFLGSGLLQTMKPQEHIDKSSKIEYSLVHILKCSKAQNRTIVLFSKES